MFAGKLHTDKLLAQYLAFTYECKNDCVNN